MKLHRDANFISALLLSLCLLSFVPVALVNISTWREIYFAWPGVQIQNYLMPYGFAHLGIIAISLIVLWTGYRKRERWAWFVMLIVVVCFFFPAPLSTFLQMHTDKTGWAFLDALRTLENKEALHCIVTLPSNTESISQECMFLGMIVVDFKFVMMLIALLLPLRSFFGKRPKPAAA